MLDKDYFTKIKKDLLGYAEIRREVIKLSGDALHNAKRAIFAAQKDDLKISLELLGLAHKNFFDLKEKHKADLSWQCEGSYRSAVEEFVEAKLFYSFLTQECIGVIDDMEIDSDVYISGLADVPGELYRYAVRAATRRDVAQVKKCLQGAEEIVEWLLDMNLTGYARQKFDQAKAAYAKIEQLVYELSLREKI